MSIYSAPVKSSIGPVGRRLPIRKFRTAVFSDQVDTIHPPTYQLTGQVSGLLRAAPRRAALDTSCSNSLPLVRGCRRLHSHRDTRSGDLDVYQLTFQNWLNRVKNSSRQKLRCKYSTTSSSNQARENAPSKEELLALVGQYSGSSITDHSTQTDSHLIHDSPEPDLIVSDTDRDIKWPSKPYVWPSYGENRAAIEKLEDALKHQDLHDAEECYQMYRAISPPRVPYLNADTRHSLLKRLGASERKSERVMLRYLSVIDDLKATGIPLTTPQWNMAISFAGRYVARTSVTEAEGALRTWRDMEHIAGVRSNAATFNILFDVASKAGKFRLAEMIYKEMERRGHSFSRFHYVSLIHYHGLRADGDGVRKAYKDLVNSHEVIDIIVLNCLISSLIRCFEPQAALYVYEAMKKLHASKYGDKFLSKGVKKSRQTAKVLSRLATRAKKKPEKQEALQNSAVITPDFRTYRILIQYVAITAGELHRTAQILDEMRLFEIPNHGSIFLALFKAFAIHGGIRYSNWTTSRLESVWKAYLQAATDTEENVYFGKWIVFWALKAFRSCADEAKAIEIWDDLKSKWTPDDTDLLLITSALSEEFPS